MERFPEKPIGSDGKPMSDAAWIDLHKFLARMELKYADRLLEKLKAREVKGA